MTPQEATHEAEELLQLFMMCTSSKNKAQRTAIISVKREIELLEHILKENLVVQWAIEKFNKMVTNKKLLLESLKNIRS